MRRIAIACIAAALVCLLAQSVIWLRYGQWPLLVLGHALDVVGIPSPRTGWIGFDQSVRAVGRAPLALVLAGIGACMMLAARRS